GAAVHAGAVVAEHAQVLELVGLDEVTLLDHEHPAPAFGLSAGEGLGGLRDQAGAVETRGAAERTDNEAEEAAPGGISLTYWEVDDLVSGGVEGGGSGARGNRHTGADLACEDAKAALIDEPGEPDHRLLVGAGPKQR